MGKKKLSDLDRGARKAYNDAFKAADPLGNGNLDTATAVGNKAEHIYRNRSLMNSKARAKKVTADRLKRIKEEAKKVSAKNSAFAKGR